MDMKVFRNLTIAMLVVAAGCGGGGDSSSIAGVGTGTPTGGTPAPTGGTTAPTSTNAVSISDNQFTPSAILVSVGTTVTWTWATGASTHNVTFADGTVSGDHSSGTFARTFTTAGTFNYLCTLHAGMTGSVTVQ
jgi:plastocyanin